jgi:AraC-like DNA-binding protein
MDNLFTAVVNKDMAWEMTHFHFHDPYEILFVTRGTCTFLLESEMIRATRGTVLLIRSGLLHMSTSLPDEEYVRYIINFNPAVLRDYSSRETDLLEAFQQDHHAIFLNETETQEVEILFRTCENKTRSYGSDLRRNMAFLELLVRLGELSREGRHSNPNLEGEAAKNYRRVKPIISYILENPTHSLSLEEVAEKFFYNKHYLCRIFKTATGISVGKYITSVRIQYAAQFLRQGHSVQESGEMAGFKNNSNFISTFRKVMEVSPGQYRQRYRQNFDPKL